MIHELDEAIRQVAQARPACSPRHSVSAGDVARIERNRAGEAVRPASRDRVRMGLCHEGRALNGSTLRVIETTWRLWREPA